MPELTTYIKTPSHRGFGYQNKCLFGEVSMFIVYKCEQNCNIYSCEISILCDQYLIAAILERNFCTQNITEENKHQAFTEKVLLKNCYYT